MTQASYIKIRFVWRTSRLATEQGFATTYVHHDLPVSQDLTMPNSLGPKPADFDQVYIYIKSHIFLYVFPA